MNIRKVFLYIALVFILISLWKSWQTDSSKRKLLDKQKATELQKNKPEKVEGVGAIPIIRANNKVRANQESQNVSKNKEEKLIHVKTDVLSVNINTLGGNLVDGWLLKYPASLKDKNVPIQILNNKNSGFLGIQKILKYEVLKSNTLKKGHT